MPSEQDHLEQTRDYTMRVLVSAIHNPIAHGASLLLLPAGLLVRWPPRVPMPAVGDHVQATALTVDESTAKAVIDLLFGATVLQRCDAAIRLAKKRENRSKILGKIYHRSYVHLLVKLGRSGPRVRAWIEVQNPALSIRELARIVDSQEKRQTGSVFSAHRTSLRK
ncbi:MAG: hypothetical protein IPK82_19995 [Polyangiaceae bacterium]|nr:hypothetical protein [Polyangiaceae bacterium]